MIGKNVVFATAADEKYFDLALDMINSLERANGSMPRVVALDVGMTEAQRRLLSGKVENIVIPDFDFGRRNGVPDWYRAVTARPFLPKYVTDAEVIVSIDSDTWIQNLAPLERLIADAHSGDLSIVEEIYGMGVTLPAQTASGAKQLRSDENSVKANLRSCYSACFGHDVALAYSQLPQFNSGVFALRRDSPAWNIWRDYLELGLNRNYHVLVEQTALNIAIRMGKIKICRQPLEANYVCHLELPWYSPTERQFTLPGRKKSPLGVVHLTDMKHHQMLPIPQFPDGKTKLMPLLFRSLDSHLSDNS